VAAVMVLLEIRVVLAVLLLVTAAVMVVTEVMDNHQ
jgi:hypothetical protein